MAIGFVGLCSHRGLNQSESGSWGQTDGGVSRACPPGPRPCRTRGAPVTLTCPPPQRGERSEPQPRTHGGSLLLVCGRAPQGSTARGSVQRYGWGFVTIPATLASVPNFSSRAINLFSSPAL